jgi:hypothetical protein
MAAVFTFWRNNIRLRSVVRLVLLGVLTVIAFDALASLASRSLDFPYLYATIGSLLIYAALGFTLGRTASVSFAAASVAVIAFTEATIGWWLSGIIGPGKPKSGLVSSTQIVTTVVSMVVIGAIIGAVAGALGRSHPKFDAP